MIKTSRLVLHQLEFFVFLGAEFAERRQQQRIMVDIHVDFTEPPAACTTDLLTDTFCYDTLNQTIKKNIALKEFRLLEHLTHEIYLCVKNFLSRESKVSVQVTKFPDAFFKSAGVSFWYSDDK
jgi:FolB domain-containing protein